MKKVTNKDLADQYKLFKSILKERLYSPEFKDRLKNLHNLTERDVDEIRVLSKEIKPKLLEFPIEGYSRFTRPSFDEGPSMAAIFPNSQNDLVFSHNLIKRVGLKDKENILNQISNLVNEKHRLQSFLDDPNLDPDVASQVLNNINYLDVLINDLKKDLKLTNKVIQTKSRLLFDGKGYSPNQLVSGLMHESDHLLFLPRFQAMNDKFINNPQFMEFATKSDNLTFSDKSKELLDKAISNYIDTSNMDDYDLSGLRSYLLRPSEMSARLQELRTLNRLINNAKYYDNPDIESLGPEIKSFKSKMLPIFSDYLNNFTELRDLLFNKLYRKGGNIKHNSNKKLKKPKL